MVVWQTWFFYQYCFQVFLGAFSPSVFQSLYAATVHWCAPFVFFAIAGLTALGLFGSFFLVFSGKPQHAAKGSRTERQPLLLND